MKKRLWVYLVLLLMIPVLLGTVSCAKKTVVKEEPVPVVVPAPAPAPVPAKGDAVKEFEMAKEAFLNEKIHFAFDKSYLDEKAQTILKKKATFLKANPDIYITIGGHTDERGTAEYNLALGERRAESAKSFLVDLGIPAYRLSTVSYGEEKPLCNAKTEECWARNRRDEFVIN
ncbi:MAG: peptidoglycan-associated lipoprotein Pal [Desulfobacterales bacterium]